jgi:hypothetical protein
VKRGKAAEPPVETTPTSRPARDAIAEAPRAELPLEQRAVATSERCACGNVYGDGREVHQELRGGALVAFCEGCA